MRYYVRTTETTDVFDSMRDVEKAVEDLVRNYGITEINVVDENGVLYDFHIELEPHRLPNWIDKIHIDPMLAMV